MYFGSDLEVLTFKTRFQYPKNNLTWMDTWGLGWIRQELEGFRPPFLSQVRGPFFTPTAKLFGILLF